MRRTNMLLFLLSQKNLALAQAEVASLYPIIKIKEQYVFVDQPLIVNIPLAYTREMYEILFSSSKKNLIDKIKNYNWNKTIKGTYCVRSNVQEKERTVADIIWQTLQKSKVFKKPKVDLEYPDTLIHFWFFGKKVYCGILIWENDNAFLQRKATHRPGFYPASLDPQLALAMINLSGAEKNKMVIDPFCGTGGILIEAVLSGRKAVGYDKSLWMLEKCKQNLVYYGLEKKVTVKQGDATMFRKRCAAIVTEPPFGKNTKTQDLGLLYSQFLENAEQNTKKLVISFPDSVDWRKFVKKTNWKIKEKFLWYVHGSLSKWIVVLKK